MRLPAAFCIVGALACGCAHVEAPPGGPEDRIPPTIASTSPTTDTTVAPSNTPVVIQFDERISQDRIEEAVSVSPRTSPVEVRHGRSSIRVSLRNGWEADQIYQVTIHPVLRDLFGNALRDSETLIFSTGPEIPESSLSGVVTDGITGRPATGIRVEAIRSPDSLVYAARTDTAGRFSIASFPLGGYRVRAFEDANRNRSLELFEASDSTTGVSIEAGSPVTVRLSLLEADSTAPVIASVAVDSLVLDVTFDDYLDPSQTIEPTQAIVTHPTGGAVGVDAVRVVGVEPPPDAEGLLPSRDLEVYLSEGAILDPSVEYGVRITGIRNVNGVTGDADSTFEPPEPPEPPETPDPAADPAAGVVLAPAPAPAGLSVGADRWISLTGVAAGRYAPGGVPRPLPDWWWRRMSGPAHHPA